MTPPRGDKLRIAYLAAGAGGMYCGSCLHDNTLAAALLKRGHEVALLPTYTPLRTDETSVASSRVFYGALNVYLEQKSHAFRHTPRWLHWLLDRPRLLRWLATRFAGSTDARELGALTLSVLRGEEGPQAGELARLVGWLRDDYRPDVVHITNSLLLGLVRRLKRELGGPVVVQLQGEDLFLDELPNREEVIEEMRRRARDVDLFVAPSRFYADKMTALLDVPAERVAVVPLGIRLEGYGTRAGRDPQAPPAIGYLARVAPEKGLHLLAEAFAALAVRPGNERLRLRVAGWLGAKDRAYFREIEQGLAARGLGDRFDHVGEVDLAGKLEFLRSIDLLSVPTTYEEPKGLFALEAMASGCPVVLPRHGSFPEMLAATGGGLLVEPNDLADLSEALARLLADPEERRRLAADGHRAVHARFGAAGMAEATEGVYRRVLAGRRHAG
jgi:glycosyltransferase involved in cell wall biosynthesis